MAKEITYEEIVRNLKNRVYSPVYFLMGEEDYYIDRISDYIMDTVLSEVEKEFNLTVLYGADTDMAGVINAAKRYPMMSEHQVIVVKEAQGLKGMECYHPSASEEDALRLVVLAGKLHLHITEGSDFHGESESERT